MADPTTQLSDAVNHAPNAMNAVLAIATLFGGTIAGAITGTLKYGERLREAEKKVEAAEAKIAKVEGEAGALRDRLEEFKRELQENVLNDLRAEIRAEMTRAPASMQAEIQRIVDQVASGLRADLTHAKDDINRLRADAQQAARDGSEKWEGLSRTLGRLEQATKILGGP
jgi:molecular chaperone GrpE (heat shock protein)